MSFPENCHLEAKLILLYFIQSVLTLGRLKKKSTASRESSFRLGKGKPQVAGQECGNKQVIRNMAMTRRPAIIYNAKWDVPCSTMIGEG